MLIVPEPETLTAPLGWEKAEVLSLVISSGSLASSASMVKIICLIFCSGADCVLVG